MRCLSSSTLESLKVSYKSVFTIIHTFCFCKAGIEIPKKKDRTEVTDTEKTITSHKTKIIFRMKKDKERKK